MNDLVERTCIEVRRDPEHEELEKLIADAALETYVPAVQHQTSLGDRVVCSSFLQEWGDGHWRLSWLETKQQFQSRGFGSKHVRALLDWIKAVNHEPRALFFEICSRRELGISEEELQSRYRRFAFYEKLGAKLWQGDVLLPRGMGEPQPGASLSQVELMWFELDAPVTEAEIETALRRLFSCVANLSVGHPLVNAVIKQEFPNGLPRTLWADSENFETTKEQR